MRDTEDQELLTAAKAGDISGITRALEAGAHIDEVDEQGWTAAMWAAYTHRLDIIKILSQAGANLAIRDGLNHDAKDLALYALYQRSLNTEITAEIRQFIKHEEGYRTRQEEFTKRAHKLAGKLKKLLKGEVQSTNGISHRDWRVDGRYNNMRCVGWVFAGGFDLWVQNFHGDPITLYCNLEHRDNSSPVDEHGLVSVIHQVTPTCTVYTMNGSEAGRTGAQRFTRDEHNYLSIVNLGLGRYESLVVGPRQLRLWSSTEDPTLLEQRLEVLSTLFHRNSHSVPPPIISTAYRVKFEQKPKSRKKLPYTHVFGGQLPHTVECPTCQAALQPIARLDCRDPAFPALSWPHPTLEVLFCTNCSLFAGPTWVDHSTEVPRILQQEDATDMGRGMKPLEETPFSLVPLKRKGWQQSKLGGLPTWMQFDEVPDCCRCEKAMQFVAQLTGNNNIVSFAEEGTLYVFICTDCAVSANVMQFH